MITTPRTAILKVPGARIHHEVRGQGPLLLIIPGGPQDAGVFSELAEQLADRFTVVTYDPRGNSRTESDTAAGDLSLDLQGDDAAALIAAMDRGPAYVFGTSGGAHIGLNLAARHPALVRALVAHEPPTMMLLDDPTNEVAAARELHDLYRQQGVEAAMGKFFADNGLGGGEEGEGPPPEAMSPDEAETFARVSGNFEYWLAHGMLPLSFYRPDVDRLRAGEPRVVVGIGAASAGQPIDRMGGALARALGVERVTFPGDHLGFGSEARAFAATLREALLSGQR